jgi:hypothetical protein
MNHSKVSITNTQPHSTDLEKPGTVHSDHDPVLSHRSEEVISRPFLGRLGGNGAFTLDESDPNYDEKIRHTPDAGPSFTWKESFDLRGFLDVELWKQAFLEGWATAMLIWITGVPAYALSASVA